MKKRFYQILSISLFFVFIALFAVSCSPYDAVKKASKNLSCYKITASLNETDMTIDAKQTVEYVNKTNVVLDHVCFNLYARAFREDAKIKPYTTLNQGKCFPNGISYGDIEIINVLSYNQDVCYSFVGEDQNALEVIFNSFLEPGEKVNIEMEYKITLPECTHRLGYYNGNVNLGNWFPILAIYENGNYNITPYYSTGDPFYSDIANYFVTFSYPQKYLLSSSGDKIKSVNIDGIKTDELSGTAIRDFAITLTSEATKKSKVNSNKTLITYIGYEGDTDADKILKTAEKAIDYFSKKFGVYPYKKLDIVKTSFVHGGMEYPSLVMISDTITDIKDIYKVVVHEIAHQWWYGLVGNNEISEAWLDESLAEFSTVMFFESYDEYGLKYKEMIAENFASYTLYADIVESVGAKLKTSMILPVNEYNSEYEYSYMVYVKGVLMFDNIRQTIGKSKLENGLKKYFKNYKFKIATTEDFVSILNKVGGKNVKSIMKNWLEGKTMINANA